MVRNMVVFRSRHFLQDILHRIFRQTLRVQNLYGSCLPVLWHGACNRPGKRLTGNSVTDTKSLFESVLDMLKSKDEESMALRKDVEQLKEEAEAFSEDRVMLTEMDARIKLLEEESVQKGRRDRTKGLRDREFEDRGRETACRKRRPAAGMRRLAGSHGQDSPPGTAGIRACLSAKRGARGQLGAGSREPGHQDSPLQEAAPRVARACAESVQEGRLPANRP